MNCEKARELVLSGDTADGLQEHLSSCAGCRSMAEAWNSFSEIRPGSPVPSNLLDFKIKGAAAAHLDGLRQRQHRLVKRFAIFAAAACFVVVTWFSMDSIGTVPKAEHTARPVSSMDIGNDFYVLMSEIDLGIMSITSEFFPDFGDEPDELDIIIRAGEPLEG